MFKVHIFNRFAVNSLFAYMLLFVYTSHSTTGNS